MRKPFCVLCIFALCLLLGCASKRRATAPVSHSVSLSWNAVAGSSYNVYRKRKSEKAYTQIASGVPTTTYTDTTVVDGHTYDYAVTAVCGTGQLCGAGQESSYSNISVAVIP